MPDNRQNQSNAASISSNGPLDNIEEGMWKMKIESKEGLKEEEREKEEEEGGESKQYPDRPGEPDCGYYLRTGLCGYGTNCRFNHPPLPAKTAQNRSELPQREGQPDCGYYLKTGTCKYGSTCKYHHPLDRRGVEQVPLNSLGLPMRQEEKPCPYYMRTYTCKFGPTCKFNHPQPASFETALPPSGPSAVGTMASMLPSTAIPYVGALPTWSLTRSSYLPSSRVPSPQAYMPVVFPPLQGPIGAQTWNGYMGNMNPISASGLMGTNIMYNPAKNQGELVTNGQVDLLAMTVSQLPERPDHPECRYFMNTGSCKYGSNCKFHHPKERLAQLATNNLGPHGLPLRPGEEACAYFSAYGLCKYGPACKFNHPFPGFYSASYYIGMSPMPMFDQPFLPNPRNSAISHSSEASQSKSSKITDWIQKPENVEDKNNQQNPNPEPKIVEESPPREPVENGISSTVSEAPRDQPE